MRRSIRLALLSLAFFGFALFVYSLLGPFPLATQRERPQGLEELAIAQSTAPEALADYTANATALQSALQQFTGERFRQADRELVRRSITQRLEASGWVVTPQPFTAEGSGQQGTNIIATRPNVPLEGSLILGTHYDTVPRSPGADDNATGVVAALEAARVLAPLLRPQSGPERRSPRPLALVFFDLEEAGLLGSRAFVGDHSNVAGAVILEMLGFSCNQPGCQRYPGGLPTPSVTTGTFLAAIGDRAHSQLLSVFASEQLGPEALPVFTLAVPTAGPLAPDLLRSDHLPFWQAGIGAVLLTDTAEFRNPHYHLPTDEVSTINIDFYRRVVQLVVERVYRLL